MTTTAPEPVERPKPQSAAGGAKYHAQRLTERWKTFRDGMDALATHTAAERAEKDREREQRTSYAQAARKDQGGT